MAGFPIRRVLTWSVVLALVGLLVYAIVKQTQRAGKNLVCMASDTPPMAVSSDPRRLHVVTIVTDPKEPGLMELVRGAAAHGVFVTVIVSPLSFGALSGWGSRLRLFRAFLNRLPMQDVVMFIDGYDVLVDAGADAILKEFDAIIGGRPKILFAAEAVCFPDKHLADSYPKVTSPYKYLNGGGYMATVGVLRDALDRHMKLDDPKFHAIDDQREWTRVFLSTDAIVLDNDARVFLCLKDAEDHVRQTDRGWFNVATQSYPLVFHGNGKTTDFLFGTVQGGTRYAAKKNQGA